MSSAQNLAWGAALQAASALASNQHYPVGALYVVATPIGNLADISLRALHLLQLADTVACEDTRHTQGMLRVMGINKTSAQVLALHQHNEAQAAGDVITRLQQGQRVAYVSDAGTPGVSDPGARLVVAVRQAGLVIVPLPGASSVTALVSAAGVVAIGPQSNGFVFCGFLPNKTVERNLAVQKLAAEPRCVVLLEAPHRIETTASSLAILGERPVTVGRELTKQFEEIATVPASTLAAWFGADANRVRGEFALVIHPAEQIDSGELDLRVLKLLLAELPLKTAVKVAADITGQGKNALYAAALAMHHADQDNID